MIKRRVFVSGLLSTPIIAHLGMVTDAFAQATAKQLAGGSLWAEYQRIAVASRSLGLGVPRMQSVPASFDASEALPAFTDLLDNIEQTAKADGIANTQVEGLLNEAADLLRVALAIERMPPEAALSTGARSLSPEVRRPQFETVRADYETLFSSCRIRDDKRAKVDWYLSRLKDPSARRRYEEVAEEACVPWYFVGIIHAMEASFSFRSHLHNGDSLKRRTRHVPAGRPASGAPPFDWTISAIDALRYAKLTHLGDWSLAAMLYRWESYNGFRSRVLHKINTPYLWSFSNHYARGKYVSDGVWNGAAVSKQCGAAVMLKALVEEGIAKLPA